MCTFQIGHDDLSCIFSRHGIPFSREPALPCVCGHMSRSQKHPIWSRAGPSMHYTDAHVQIPSRLIADYLPLSQQMQQCTDHLGSQQIDEDRENC